MTEQDDVWLRLVDEPIGAIVAEIEAEDPKLRALVASPEKLLAFRTFANILKNPAHRREIEAEVRAVAEELASDEDAEGASVDEATRTRFREFARRELGD